VRGGCRAVVISGSDLSIAVVKVVCIAVARGGAVKVVCFLHTVERRRSIMLARHDGIFDGMRGTITVSLYLLFFSNAEDRAWTMSCHASDGSWRMLCAEERVSSDHGSPSWGSM